MSREDVELIRGITRAEVDLTAWFRDDATWTLQQPPASLFHEDFECRVRVPGQTRSLPGLDGLRTVWLDWLKPWESYRTEIEDVIEVDEERVLVLARDYDRRAGSNAEVRILANGLSTLRDGKIVAAEFISNRAEALEAAELRA